jgi:hypothetical protein
MKEYGWIPLEEFKKIPMQTIDNMLNEIQDHYERERKANGKAVKKRK